MASFQGKFTVWQNSNKLAPNFSLTNTLSSDQQPTLEKNTVPLTKIKQRKIQILKISNNQAINFKKYEIYVQ